jgi:hypothetical protein
MMIMRRPAARFTTVLAFVAASLAWGLPASAAEGFDVTVEREPGTITIGKDARTLTAVATTDREQRCRKVRWALTVRTEGVSLDQIRILRVENDRSFRIRTQVAGADTARLIDAQPDPGQLCPGRTVTGRWDVAFAGPDSGTVTFEASALEANGRELATTSTTSRVVTPVAATPSPTPTQEESTGPEEDEDEDGGAPGGGATPADPPTSAAALDPAAAAGSFSVLGPGLIVGAVLVFVGVGLLLRLRARNRRDPVLAAQTRTLPNGFYGDAPPRRL